MDIAVGVIDHRNQTGLIIAKPTVSSTLAPPVAPCVCEPDFACALRVLHDEYRVPIFSAFHASQRCVHWFAAFQRDAANSGHSIFHG